MQPGQRLCGAKTRKGVPCRDIAMANGRCKRHGGKATGAHNPKRSLAADNGAYTHGLYTKFFRDEEKALIDEGAIRLGQVEDEIVVMRVRLKRALEAREQWELERAGKVDGANEETAMSLVEVVDDEGLDKEGGKHDLQKRVKRLPDFDAIIDRTLARIESLEKTRKELLKDGNGSGDDGDPGTSRDRVTFTGGLGGTDEELPSPFEKS